jgi:hypothetical protein
MKIYLQLRSDTKFHPNRIINVGSTNENLFMPLKKVRPPLTGLKITHDQRIRAYICRIFSTH